MKRFIIKFCLLFAIIDGYLLWFAIAIYPNISGDMGWLERRPFGKDYNENIIKANRLEEQYVFEIHNIDSISRGSIVTIGDSYSQQGDLGYQQYLGKMLSDTIYNLFEENLLANHPVKTFIRLVNRGEIDSSNIVIIETVERGLLGRLNNFDLNDTTKVKIHKNKKKNLRVDYAQEAMQKLRLMLGYKPSLRRFSLTRPLFSHTKYHSDIFIYHSPSIGDSELIFGNDTSYILRSYDNLEKLHNFAVEHNIKMIFLIAPDKYGVYYPYIVDAPRYNITLDLCPEKDYIVNPKGLLRQALERGEKDVWYLNDTHWSPVGARIAGEEVARRIQDLKEHKE